MLGVECPGINYIRTMFGITRLLNHLMWLGSNGMDLPGASTVLMYTFRERETLFDMYEAVSGAPAAYFRPGGVYRDLLTPWRSSSRAKCAQLRPWRSSAQPPGGRWTSSTTSAPSSPITWLSTRPC